MEKREIRKLDNKLNANSESRLIEGYALVFNSMSEFLNNSFYEILDPNCLDGVIERSDVYALLNHDFNKGVLARSKNGVGTLQLTVDSVGLKYSFEAPNTDLGNSTIEAIKRGDITASSFCFSVSNFEKIIQPDGTTLRKITQINQLHDISPVYVPAYEATSAEYIRMMEEQDKEQEKEQEKRDTIINIVVTDDSTEVNTDNSLDLSTNLIVNTDSDECEETPAEEQAECSHTGETETCSINTVEEDEEDEEEDPETACNDNKRSLEINETVETKSTEINKNNNKEITRNKMENFNLISAISAIANKRGLTDEQKEFSKRGQEELKRTGLSAGGDLYIPMGETRDINATGVGFGIENVGETKSSLTMALQPNLILQKAGAKFVAGLVNDFSLPSYSATSSLWAGETAAAQDGTGAFTEQVMKPKRLTTFVDVSLQFLNQDSNDANTQLIASLQESINQKLEKTILGNVAGTGNMPAGLFNGVTGTTSATYTGITALEGAIEDLNVNDYKFIVSNKAKAILKSTVKNQASFVYDGGEIDGYETFNSGNVYGKGIIAANFNDLWIGQWGSVVLTIDNVSQMINGKVRIIINAFYDAAWVRPSYVVSQLA